MSTAILYRMGAGYPGDVNRSNPASITAELINAASPPLLYGQPVLIDATSKGVRPFVAGDTAVTNAYGFTVRPNPTQQLQANSDYAPAALGVATPPASGVIDIMGQGFIIAKVNGTPAKGDPVFVWCAVSGGAHVQGGLEAAATGGSTAALANAYYNGSPDANGYVEVKFKI